MDDSLRTDMALEAPASDYFSTDQSTDAWQLSSFSEFMNIPQSDLPDLPGTARAQPHSLSPTLLQAMVPQYIQPFEIHKSLSPTKSVYSTHSTQPSLVSLSSSVSVDRQQALRRLSLASSEFNNDTYRPRKTPVIRRKATASRIHPRSNKHARELELNRKAATKCRNRQKNFVEKLQEKCRSEEVKMHEQTALVHALHDEVVILRNEVIRQSFCRCQPMESVFTIPALTS